MGPNGVGESNGGQGQSSAGVMEPVVNPVTPTEANPNSVPNPLTGLEDAISAAKKALGQTESPAPQVTASEPVTEPVVPQSPTEQFQNTFGDAIPQASQATSEAIPAVPTESVQAPVADSSISTEPVSFVQPVENIAAEPVAGSDTQTPETQPQKKVELSPEVQKFLDDVLSAVDKYKTAEESKSVTS